MTNVFREVLSNFWLLLFYTDKIPTTEQFFETTENTFPDSMPPSLCSSLEILVCSQNAQFLRKERLENELSCRQLAEICETLPSNHHHTLLYHSDCTDDATFLKQTNFRVLSTTNNAHVKFMPFSNAEYYLRAQTNNNSACGYKRSLNSVGPGNVFTLTTGKYFKNCMLFRHFRRISLWTLI